MPTQFGIEEFLRSTQSFQIVSKFGARRAHTFIASFLALAILATACGGPASIETESATAPAADSSVAPTAEPVDLAPLSGEFPTVSGSTIDLETLQGKDVVLWFWAPW